MAPQQQNFRKARSRKNGAITAQRHGNGRAMALALALSAMKDLKSHRDYEGWIGSPWSAEFDGEREGLGALAEKRSQGRRLFEWMNPL